ncbi:hypothetical protein Pmgp_01155 [Pelotomaculum propionicicum]|uniref:Uncharacterized protein n=1 Tax=Pelotomaculum propionicicum TaxID=258475 RepID=A0A4Y7RTD0_9FIRM|nr:hypothetical protein Pmgp_01155 [Pelotomaculum propionicicum]
MNLKMVEHLVMQKEGFNSNLVMKTVQLWTEN